MLFNTLSDRLAIADPALISGKSVPTNLIPLKKQAIYLHTTTLIESDPSIACPSKVSPVKPASISSQTMPVS